GCLKRVQVWALGIGDLRLASEGEALHRDAVGRIDVRADYQRAGLVQDLVGLEALGSCADLAAPQVELLFRDAEGQQDVLHLPNRGVGREDGQDVKPEGCGELEARE